MSLSQFSKAQVTYPVAIPKVPLTSETSSYKKPSMNVLRRHQPRQHQTQAGAEGQEKGFSWVFLSYKSFIFQSFPPAWWFGRLP